MFFHEAEHGSCLLTIEAYDAKGDSVDASKARELRSSSAVA